MPSKIFLQTSFGEKTASRIKKKRKLLKCFIFSTIYRFERYAEFLNNSWYLKLGLVGDGFPGRGGNPGHFASGRGDGAGNFWGLGAGSPSVNPRHPEITKMLPFSNKFWLKRFYYRTFYLTCIVRQSVRRKIDSDLG